MSGPKAAEPAKRTPEEQAFATLCSAIADVARAVSVVDLKVDALMALIGKAAASGGEAPAGSNRPAKAEPFGDEPIPRPEVFIQAPETLRIHFGKNKDRTLGQLSENSLAWYCAKWPIRPKQDGSFWDNDVALLHAARQLWHIRRGTLEAPKT